MGNKQIILSTNSNEQFTGSIRSPFALYLFIFDGIVANWKKMSNYVGVKCVEKEIASTFFSKNSDVVFTTLSFRSPGFTATYLVDGRIDVCVFALFPRIQFGCVFDEHKHIPTWYMCKNF